MYAATLFLAELSVLFGLSEQKSFADYVRAQKFGVYECKMSNCKRVRVPVAKFDTVISYLELSHRV